MISNKLYLIDFSNLFLTYYVIFKNTKNIVPLILNYISKFSAVSPDSFFIFVSEPNSKFLKKKQIFSDYKANRQKIDNQVFTVLRGLKKDLFNYMKQSGINLLLFSEYEADDVIAKIIWDNYDKFANFIIISNDNDYIQLVQESKVKLITRKYIYGLSRDSDTLFLSQKHFRNHNSYLPPGLPYLFYKVLKGDKSDNISSIYSNRELRIIFNLKQKDFLNNLNLDFINNPIEIVKFLEKLDFKLRNKFKVEKYYLNLKLMSLYPGSLIDEIKIAQLEKYIISGENLKNIMFSKSFLLNL